MLANTKKRLTTVCLASIAILAGCSSSNNNDTGSTDGGNQNLPVPVINLDSYQAILQEVVSLINAAPLSDTLQRLTGPDFTVNISDTELLAESNSSLTNTSADGTLALFPDIDATTSSYSCNAGGSFEFIRSNMDLTSQLDITDCTIGENTFNGRYGRSAGRDTNSIHVTELSIDNSTSVSVITASYARDFYRQGGGTRQWTAPGDGAALDITGDTQLSIRDYSILATSSPLAENPQARVVQLTDGSQFDVTQNAVRAAIDGAFEVVSAPWANEQGLNVQVSLSSNRVYYTSADSAFTPGAQPVQFVNTDGTLSDSQTLDDKPRAPFAWRSGSVVISADDGSTLMLVPANVQARTFEVTISDVASPITLQWSAGFEINCTEATLAECDQY